MHKWCDGDRVLFNYDGVCKALMKMKVNEASGAVGIYDENLRYASPEIVVMLNWLINEYILHAYAPKQFDISIIRPVL